MKKILLSLFLIGIISFVGIPQRMHDKPNKHRNKLAQLEKAKLIEALELDEETSIRFFARRNQSKKDIDELEKKSDEIIVQLENTMKEKDSPKDENQKRLIADLLKTRLQIESEKQKFINSLSDILSTEQIARLLVFEKRFREEIRNVLFDRRSPNKK
ncbi:MAG: hypothetical protein PHY57_05005 [Ignavibacterium sp.]|jgi:hypothetical protein|nr:MAG: hypothetical protein F9K42_02260 [Ignavibacterium sp.]MDD5607849.1 hypothetical protein [Ignavibacterium sp.]MDX9711883.1 hypothetical protein [Ignavibacteriaceae bacterium]MEB2354821.1 hypothetical protein [Ignavibacteriales bacterium]GIK21258.1 MAG: hypothetical protein BroJett005_06720 [Ignavibacteriota bacterium]